MHILILNQTFHPDVAATAQHMWDLARFLTAAGHQVSAIASRNVYGTDKAAFAARESIDGIQIIRVGGTAMGKRSLLHRLADFGSFYLRATWALLRLKPMPDVVIALTSPPMISAVAAAICRFRRTDSGQRPRFVYYVMDLYPEAAIASGVFASKGLPDRLFSAITRWTLKKADHIIALGRDMKKLLLDHYDAPVDKITIATPWADGREIFPIPRQQNPLLGELGLKDTFNIVYSGNFGIAHDVTTITDAIELTRDDPGLCWIFIGGGKRMEQLKRQAAENRWPHVRILPYQPRERLNESLNLADVHLISQLPAFTGIVVPSKLFGILAAGKPAIMIGPADCEVSRIIEENHAGAVIANGAAASLASAIRHYRTSPPTAAASGHAARQAFETKYDASITCTEIASAL